MGVEPIPLSSESSALQRSRNERGTSAIGILAGWWRSLAHTGEVNRQLRNREADLSHMWERVQADPTVVAAVCESIRAAAGWCNGRFVPGDSLWIVLDTSFDSLVTLELLNELEDRLGLELDVEEFPSEGTVGDLVVLCDRLWKQPRA